MVSKRKKKEKQYYNLIEINTNTFADNYIHKMRWYVLLLWNLRAGKIQICIYHTPICINNDLSLRFYYKDKIPRNKS